MSNRDGKGKKNQSDASLIARNKKARFDYEVLDAYEAGIALLGSEVKSLRNRDVSINEAFVRPREGELWVLGMNIKPYKQANIQNHEPLRARKLLLHRREITRIVGKSAERGHTIVPLKLYWKHGVAKVRIGIVRGRKKYDKREVIKKREAKREMQRAVSEGRRL